MAEETRKIDRRAFARGAAMVPLAAGLERLGFAAAGSAGTTMFAGVQTIGTANKGILAYGWDAGTGTLMPQGLAITVENPTFIALNPDRKLLFAAQELNTFKGEETGAVASFRIGGSRLIPVNAEAADGQGTCHVGVDHTGRTLLCANYTGGSAASFRIGADGALSPAVSKFHYAGHGPNKERQEAPHVHRATASPDNRYALFNDLGLDAIHIYKMDVATAELTPHTPPTWQAKPGSGPRALRFHPNGKVAYCVLELASAVAVLDWDAAHGTLTTKQQVSLVPAEFHGIARASEIVLDRTGAFAYAASRDFDCLVTFAVDPGTGMLRFLARTSCGGKIPRHIALDPSENWLLVANQDSDNIAIFARDAKTGLLSGSGKSVPVAKPQCLVFV